MNLYPCLAFILSMLTAVLATSDTPLRIVLATGGCWHNYTTHKNALRAAFNRANVSTASEVASLPCANSSGKLAALEKLDWSVASDVVIFNRCYVSKDSAYIRNIVRGLGNRTALVALHCAMHSFRDAVAAVKAEWHELLGVVSRKHGVLSIRCCDILDNGAARVRGIELDAVG